MSTPFAVFLRTLRLRGGFSQLELAKKLGYEQTYVSAIELGTKPPSSEFLAKLTETLALADSDQRDLERELEDSPRRIVIPSDLPTNEYRLYAELRRKVGQLLPAQIDAIRTILRMDDEMAARPRYGVARLRRKAKEEPKM